MPRYGFERAARAALLDELIAAGVTPEAVEMDEVRCWVTCSPEEYARAAAVVAAHDPAAYTAREEQDRQVRRLDLAIVRNYLTNGAPTLAQTVTALKALIRVFAAALTD